MNYIDYFHHALYLPGTYYRRYDLDLEPAQEIIKRVALASLPFVGLYRPAGFALSLGMNTTRTFSHLQQALLEQDQRNWKNCAFETGKASLAMLSLSTTLFHYTSALFITTGWDALHGAVTTGQAFYAGNYSAAYEEALQTLASAAYLSFMATGALEAMVAFALFQATLSLYQARHEMSQGRYLEASAKLIMASVRLNQTQEYFTQIQKRNAYLEMQATRNLFLKIMRGRQASHLVRHPLSSLKERIDAKDVVLTNGDDSEVHFGAHFHGHGSALVKGENLAFRIRTIDGQEIVELDFKVNHAFRDKIDEALGQLKKIKTKELEEILSLTGSHAKGISFESDSFLPESNGWFGELGEAHKIKIEGLGNILIGSSADQPTLYDRVVVQLNANQTLYELHEMLSFMDLDQAICLSTQDDIERLKMGHLFRTFFPREATPFERTEEFFTLPLDQLKSKMIEKSPEMENIFDTYYHRMKKEHLFDGRIRYRIEGLAEEAWQRGARALTAAITGVYTMKDIEERLASILRLGMISTETRDANDFGNHGLGSGVDYMSGGADSVFTQLLTEKNCQDEMKFNELYYQSKVRLLISLEALETGTYQYHCDNFGNRIYQPSEEQWWDFDESYASRDGILEFIEKEQAATRVNRGHEVMLKERIAPTFIKGLIVPDEQTKSHLVDFLRANDLVQNETILNKPIEEFVRVGTKVTEDLIR